MGMTKIYDTTSGQWVKVGKSGAPGKSVRNGTGAPTAGTGADGDFYVDTSNYNFYGPKATGAWGSYAAMLGAPFSTVGNLLTANQASGTDTLGDTTGFVASGVSAVSTTTAPIHGTRSLEITFSIAGAAGVYLGSGASNTVRVAPGQLLTIQADVIGVAGETAALVITPLNSVGGSAGTPIFGPTFTLTGVLQTVSATTLLPSTASVALAQGYIRRATGAAGSVWKIDRIGLWAGAGGEWAMPGTPITNLGTKVSHPNVDDVLVQRWDSSLGRWQTIHYDSGRRSLSAIPENGWTVSSLMQIARQDNLVTLYLAGVGGAAATSDVLYTLPTGFRPDFTTRVTAVTNGNATIGAFITSGAVTITRATLGAATLQCQISWTTRDALPSSLPGTLDLSAPA